uniref:NADH dehydrogenase subunit 6 n=1 Tax=Megalocaria dilatata TaxID=511882 RepID=UPI0020798DDB|nr:NADH dehydrogenase subunit 6 [Megalocaria dilatata]URN72806.1 NADH dehydrogenase subunit 6 [Megalocaria dilatata]
MFLLLMTSTLMILLKHPLSMGFLILIHTILTCLILGMMSSNFWFSYILILVMIGGLLVLFIYMTSIASNEKFNYNNIMFIMMILMLFMYIYSQTNNFYLNQFNLNNELTYNFMNKENFKFNMSKFLNFPNSNIFIITIFYLLVTMIAIVKITKLNFGPLKQIK